jgi:hypothetical protein
LQPWLEDLVRVCLRGVLLHRAGHSSMPALPALPALPAI